MSSKKLLNWILFTIALIIIYFIFYGLIFNTSPTKATVENFLKENSCNPSTTETDFNSEWECTYYLREHTFLIFGQILSVSRFSPLNTYSPFGYFSYDPTPWEYGCLLTHSCKNDEHMYIFIVTRDEGPLVYNPINGNLKGRYDDLVQERGCDVQPYEKPFFPISSPTSKLEWAYLRCQSDETQRQLDALN
ncbi:MAG: hypothetical protein KJ939_00850 [Nanoarchaeota archaeon]|nr:hypothetical protein [Nanoarchaeota archaeon]MCG2719606.1 hypothetical protein [Nanoarchaeota archaeon]